jgi:formamidopyrimidine-DNA glycosylase
MPELPEVEFARGCLERWLGGRVIACKAPESRVFRGASAVAFEALSGRRLRAVRRRGKWILAELDGGAGFLLHLGMTGKLVRAGGDVRHARATIAGDDGTVVAYRDPRMFGRIVPGPLARLEEEPAWRGMGPDAWDDPPDAQRLAGLFSGSRRAIKDLLMDQALLAGLGNIQATEALFEARVNPARRAGTVTRGECSRLVKGIRATLARTLALEEGDEITYVEEAGASNPFRVYGRDGEPCPRCRTRLVRLVIAGRSSVFCPGCQPREP